MFQKIAEKGEKETDVDQSVSLVHLSPVQVITSSKISHLSQQVESHSSGVEKS